MQNEAAAPALPSPTTRSRVSNGRKLFLAGDGRSTEARRFRDLIIELARPLGGMAMLPEATRQIVRRAATLSVQAETLEGRMTRGDEVDPVAFATVSNTLSRLLARLDKAAAKTAPKAPTLAEHLAARRAEKAAQPQGEAVA